MPVFMHLYLIFTFSISGLYLPSYLTLTVRPYFYVQSVFFYVKHSVPVVGKKVVTYS